MADADDADEIAALSRGLRTDVVTPRGSLCIVTDVADLIGDGRDTITQAT